MHRYLCTQRQQERIRAKREIAMHLYTYIYSTFQLFASNLFKSWRALSYEKNKKNEIWKNIYSSFHSILSKKQQFFQTVLP